VAQERGKKQGKGKKGGTAKSALESLRGKGTGGRPLAQYLHSLPNAPGAELRKEKKKKKKKRDRGGILTNEGGGATSTSRPWPVHRSLGRGKKKTRLEPAPGRNRPWQRLSPRNRRRLDPTLLLGGGKKKKKKKKKEPAVASTSTQRDSRFGTILREPSEEKKGKWEKKKTPDNPPN